MKLRLEKELVRLRLLPEEINLLKVKKGISEQISISKENRFHFSLSIVDHGESCIMVFEGNSLMISIPIRIANKWLDTNQVGVKETIATDDGETIVLIVEEDLPPRKNKLKI